MKRDCKCLRTRHEHGTRAAYTTDRCRCFDCRIAQARCKASGNYADGREVSRCGSVRRIQALVACGWPLDVIGRRMGRGRGALREFLATPGNAYTLLYVAEDIAAVYDEMWCESPPASSRAERCASTKARRHAAARGWALPLAWDDDTIDDPAATPYKAPARVDYTHPDLPKIGARRRRPPPTVDDIAVELAMRGDKVRLTHAERVEAVWLLHERGLNPTEIARRLRMSGASVTAYLDERAAA